VVSKPTWLGQGVPRYQSQLGLAKVSRDFKAKAPLKLNVNTSGITKSRSKWEAARLDQPIRRFSPNSAEQTQKQTEFDINSDIPYSVLLDDWIWPVES
jgi:hypothetical protein